VTDLGGASALSVQPCVAANAARFAERAADTESALSTAKTHDIYALDWEAP
jgi:hypothetical protein